MMRKLFTLCATVSLVLCVAACAMWARSYVRFDRLVIGRFDDEHDGLADVDAACVNGTVRIVRIGGGPAVVAPARRWQLWSEHRDEAWGWSLFPVDGFLGFGYLSTPGVNRMAAPASAPAGMMNGSYFPPVTVVQLPIWFLAVATSVLPCVAASARVRRRRRLASGLCPACGYDLRATPDRCPECGAAGGVVKSA